MIDLRTVGEMYVAGLVFIGKNKTWLSSSKFTVDAAVDCRFGRVGAARGDPPPP